MVYNENAEMLLTQKYLLPIMQDSCFEVVLYGKQHISRNLEKRKENVYNIFVSSKEKNA